MVLWKSCTTSPNSRIDEVLSANVENLKKYGKLCAEEEKVRAKAIGMGDLDG
jgi:hypothetical protein